MRHGHCSAARIIQESTNERNREKQSKRALLYDHGGMDYEKRVVVVVVKEEEEKEEEEVYIYI